MNEKYIKPYLNSIRNSFSACATAAAVVAVDDEADMLTWVSILWRTKDLKDDFEVSFVYLLLFLSFFISLQKHYGLKQQWAPKKNFFLNIAFA